jgi:hypothetical protein
MQDTQNYLKSYWADGHKGNLNRAEYEARIKKAMEDYRK